VKGREKRAKVRGEKREAKLIGRRLHKHREKETSFGTFGQMIGRVRGRKSISFAKEKNSRGSSIEQKKGTSTKKRGWIVEKGKKKKKRT